MTAAASPDPRKLAARRKPIGFFRRQIRFFAELSDALAQAVRSLAAHKLRAALTIAGVSVGIMAVIIIFMVESGMQTSFARQLNSLGPNTLYVHKWAWGVGGRDWWKLRNRPAVGQGDYRALVANTKLPVAIAPVANTEAARSSISQTPIPCMTRSKNMNTPARTSVTPVRSRAKWEVGVEPTLTIGHSNPARRSASAASTAAFRSASAAADKASGSRKL